MDTPEDTLYVVVNHEGNTVFTGTRSEVTEHILTTYPQSGEPYRRATPTTAIRSVSANLVTGPASAQAELSELIRAVEAHRNRTADYKATRESLEAAIARARDARVPVTEISRIVGFSRRHIYDLKGA